MIKELIAVLNSDLNDTDKLKRCAVIYLRSVAQQQLKAQTPPHP
jgi:hypothetical protein